MKNQRRNERLRGKNSVNLKTLISVGPKV